MPFTYAEVAGGNYEVIMKPGTVSARPKVDRRFAFCTHKNDAEVIADALNMVEELGLLKKD